MEAPSPKIVVYRAWDCANLKWFTWEDVRSVWDSRQELASRLEWFGNDDWPKTSGAPPAWDERYEIKRYVLAELPDEPEQQQLN